MSISNEMVRPSECDWTISKMIGDHWTIEIAEYEKPRINGIVMGFNNLGFKVVHADCKSGEIMAVLNRSVPLYEY